MSAFPEPDAPTRAAWKRLQAEIDKDVEKDRARLLRHARTCKVLDIRTVRPAGGGPEFYDVVSVRHDPVKKRAVSMSICTFIHRAAAEDFVARAQALRFPRVRKAA